MDTGIKKAEKFLKDNGVDTKGIFSINSFSSRQNTIRVRFRTINLRNTAEQTLRSKFETHKHRIAGAEGDRFPREQARYGSH